MLKWGFLVVGMLTSIPAMAYDYFRGRTITGVGVTSSNSVSVLFFSVSGDLAGMPSCAATKRFAINSNSPNYKEVVSLVLAAYHSQEKNIDIAANSSCNTWENAQDLIGIKSGNMPF